MSRLDIRDINKNRIQLVDSSLAWPAAVNEDGAEAVAWIDGKGWTPQPVPKFTGVPGKHAYVPGVIGVHAHLDRAQARALGEALLAFANEKE